MNESESESKKEITTGPFDAVAKPRIKKKMGQFVSYIELARFGTHARGAIIALADYANLYTKGSRK